MLNKCFVLTGWYRCEFESMLRYLKCHEWRPTSRVMLRSYASGIRYTAYGMRQKSLHILINEGVHM